MAKNNGVFYQEIRSNSKAVQELMDKEDAVLACMSDAAQTLIWLSEQARKEGLLWLEEAASGERVSKLVLGYELKRMIDLVVDGTDPEIVEDISMKRYFSRNYNGLEGFLYLIYLDGALNIQAGETPWVFRKSVLSFMPDQVGAEMDRILEEESKAMAKTAEERWCALFQEGALKTGMSAEFYTVRMLDFCISAMNDEDMGRFLREVENWDLAVTMKLLSGSAYKKIHDNTSERLRTMLIEDFECMGPVRMKDIVETDCRLFQTILKLGENREISVPGGLDKIFAVYEENSFSVEDDFSKEMKSFFKGMTNRDVQRVLKDIPQDTLTAAMKGWDRELRRLVCGNLPTLVAGIVTRDMERTDYSEKSIKDANEMISGVIRRLEDCGEVFIRG
ncbi:MAG: hypothetical protein K6A69_05570 [Lachnospiraceae bacterium]|nr:hypothetical protein [Lachnospiraceae bacterium]